MSRVDTPRRGLCRARREVMTLESRGQLLRREREAAGKSLRALSAACGVSPSGLSKHERNGTCPDDVFDRAADFLARPLMRLNACTDCRIGFFRGIPTLDQVDMHPMAVLNKLVEELDEGARRLRELRLINKLDARDLSDAERRQLAVAADQVFDVLPAAAMYLAVLDQRFALDLGGVRERYRRKVFDRGYWSSSGSEKRKNHRREPVA